jgi:adenylate cyclase
MKKIELKHFFNPWLVLATLIILVGVRVADFSFVESVRLRYFDTLITSKEPIPSDNVTIANIDDKTLQKFGQYPFPRNVYGNIVEELYQKGAGLVVWNGIFPEPDRFGGDAAFANKLQTYPVVISTVPDTTPGKSKSKYPVGVSVIGGDIDNYAVKYPGLINNISIIENNAVGVGVVNTLPEIDGVTRRMPMLISVDGKLWPNLALETLRVAAGDPSFQVKVGDAGIQAVRIPKFKTIETDPVGQIWLSWNTNFKEFSVANIPNLDGKIVIVGVTAKGLANPVGTSIGAQYPHHIQGTVIDTLASGVNIKRLDFASGLEIILICIIGLGIIVVAPRVSIKFFAPTIIGVLAATYYGSAYRFQTNQELWDPIFPMFTFAIVFGHVLLNNFAREFLQKLQIKKQFGTYLSPAMVEKLQKNPELLALGGESRELSIMFTDVRGFTTISEHYGADVQGLTKIMNRYMTAMTKKIIDNNGTLDKYIGDAQMAFWNAPLDDPNHAKNAVRTAIEMMESLDAFNAEITKEGIPAFGMGLGINTGTVVVGNMGSDQRFDYTCLGDSVNLASRLEGQSKPYGVKMILGSLTAAQVKDEYPVVELDCIAVKGKTEGIKIFTLGKSNWKHQAFLDKYYAGDWTAAKRHCEKLAEDDTELKQYYINMLERLNEGLPANWDGTFRATSK